MAAYFVLWICLIKRDGQTKCMYFGKTMKNEFASLNEYVPTSIQRVRRYEYKIKLC